MIIKKFSEQLLPAAAKLCRLNMEFDIMPDFLLREKTFGDKDYDPSLTLVAYNANNESPVGFIQAVIKQREEEKPGYIKLLCVDAAFRRKGLGTLLHKEVLEKLKSSGVKIIRVYESFPNYFMPGIDKNYSAALSFFENAGYKKFSETANLSADLSVQYFDTQNKEATLKTKGISFRRATENDKEEIAQFIHKNFRAWLEEVFETLKNNPVTLFIAEKNEKIIAFCAHEGNNKGTGWFGPMGTKENFRGIGLGAVLLKKSLFDLKNMGYQKAIIPWVGPVQFYMQNCNCKVERIFFRYEKKLE
jgi:ribosomal protein S18 acetylase RimI-like enzyme